MPIEVKCSGCERTLRVADQHAGKQARCPECGALTTLPQLSSAAAAPAAAPATSAPATSAPAAAELLWQMRTPEGQSYGPATKAELDQWVGEGRVSAECQLQCGQGDWQPAAQVYPTLGAAAPLASHRTTANPFADITATRSGTAAGYATGGRRYARAHRGGLVLTLGILSWVMSCPIFSVMAWVMGSNDLREMRSGRMDPSGMGLTQAGQILGMIYSLLWIVVVVIMVFMFLLVAAAG